MSNVAHNADQNPLQAAIQSALAGQLEVVESVCRSQVDGEKALAFSLCAIGRACAGQNHQKIAEDLFRRALAVDPDCLDALANLGTLLVWQRNFQHGLRHLDAALTLAPGNYHCLIHAGQALMALDRQELALQRYDAALTISPKTGSLLFITGNILLNLGRLGQAAERFEQCLATEPENVNALNNLGAVLNEQRRFSDGLAVLEHAKLLLPESVSVVGNMCVALNELERFAETLDLCAAIAERPDLPAKIHNNYANALKETGRHHQALFHYGQAVDSMPEEQQSLLSLSGKTTPSACWRRGPLNP